MVGGIWSVALILKGIASGFGETVFNIDAAKASDDNGFWSALLLATTIIVTDILPILLVLDNKFIQIFTCAHLDDQTNDIEVEPETNHPLVDVIEDAEGSIHNYSFDQ